MYTSADSVFQIAAHEDVIPVVDLYRMCEIAFEIVAPLNVGRVIARPFVGSDGAFIRTANRHDYALTPPADTLLDLLTSRGVPVTSIGKVRDLFGGRGITRAVPARSDSEGLDHVLEVIRSKRSGLVFANLVDFDSKYGHRNDPEGYARAVEAFDRRIPDLVAALDGGALLFTGDHGCDPTTPSTDHSRERTPLLAAGLPGGPSTIGTRDGFADLGATVADLLGVEPVAGTSFAPELGFLR